MALKIADTLRKRLLESDPFADIIGQEKVKKSLSSALLSNRHVIIVGPPGIGKTTLAKSIAKILGKDTPFVRVQGSPDLSVEDLLGDIDPIKALKHGPSSIEAFSKGKIFRADKGVLFFDELNRCPEKLQNALLQVLEEHKATIGSYDVDFDLDFLFIATMNPEDSSTEKLSDVLLDRFDVINMGYPETLEIEKKIVLASAEKICEVPEKLLIAIVHFVRMLRQSDKLEKKPSVRATIGLYERAQAQAVLEGRKSATLADLAAIVSSVLAHRIRLKPSSRYLISPAEFIAQEFQKNIKESPLSEDSEEQSDGL